MEELLHEFSPLFQEPMGLPLAQNRMHRIHLLPRTTPIAVRSYCYAHVEKEELEKQCSAMLQSRVI
jgi:hypothetical protein